MFRRHPDGFSSFHTQGLHRFCGGGAAGRPPCREEAGEQQHAAGRGEREWVARRYAEEQTAQQLRARERCGGLLIGEAGFEGEDILSVEAGRDVDQCRPVAIRWFRRNALIGKRFSGLSRFRKLS
jgi:hypothetical protein